MDKFERMEEIIRKKIPNAKIVEIMFCQRQKKEKRYNVTVRIDGELDIQTITNEEMEAG
jgi:hypothetical protein